MRQRILIKALKSQYVSLISNSELTFSTMSFYADDNFPLLVEDQEERLLAYKWQTGNSKYEIYAKSLSELDLPVLLTHCINVRNKVESTVSS